MIHVMTDQTSHENNRDRFRRKSAIISALLAGAMTGLMFAFVDFFRVCLVHPPPAPALFYPSFLLFFLGGGVFLGFFIHGTGCIPNMISSVTRHVFSKFETVLFWIILFSGPLYLLGYRLFSGTGISRWRYAKYGPMGVLLAGSILICTGTFLEMFLNDVLPLSSFFKRLFLLSGHIIIVILTLYADNTLYPRTYGYLHGVLWVVGAYAIFRILILIRLFHIQRFIKHSGWIYLTAVLLMGSVLPAIKNMGDLNNLRLWMLRNRSYISRFILGSIARGWITVPRFPFRILHSPEPPVRSMAYAESDFTKQYFRDKNLILITVDALRADEVTGTIMPFLASYANTTFRFIKAYAHGSSTASSFPIMFTGRLKSDPGTQTLAEIFSSGGYHTHAVIQETPVRFLKLKRGFDLLKGFDERIVIKDIATDADYSRWGWGVSALTSSDLTDRAEHFLSSGIDHPFFLWIHYFDLHQWSAINDDEISALAPDDPNIRSTSNPERYHRIARMIDKEIARLLRSLSISGLASSTIVIITADHGEGLGDKGIMHHTNYVYNSLVHVPLLIYVPGLNGGTFDAVCGLADLTPTLVEAMRGAGEFATDGVSLIPYIEGASPFPPHPPIWINDGGEQIALIDDRWKLIFSHRYGIFEEYDVFVDPGETRNIFGIDSVRDERLVRSMRTYYGTYFWADNMSR